MSLVGRSPCADPDIKVDPNVVTGDYVRIALERYLDLLHVRESFLVLGLIRAIDDVLEDCAIETLDESSDWSPTAQRLLRQGLLVVTDGALAVAEDRDLP